MQRLSLPSRPHRRRLRADRSGLAMMEFAFCLPLLMLMALYGLEVANFSLAHLRVSQAALNLADNAARVGLNSGLPTVQLRELDINDTLEGARLFGRPFNLTERGRITLSALVRGQDGQQRIHWQRCLGLKSGADWDSHYGTASLTDGTDNTTANNGKLRPQGMGPVGSEVHAPLATPTMPVSAVMFVEVNYEYKPVAGLTWLATNRTRLHYIASFMVRDRRDLTQIYNPAPAATRYTCNRYTAA